MKCKDKGRIVEVKGQAMKEGQDTGRNRWAPECGGGGVLLKVGKFKPHASSSSGVRFYFLQMFSQYY